MTGLSVQSTSAIMNRLQADGLLRREAPAARPRRPADGAGFARPEGAFSIGLKIGRRSCDLVLIDFCGGVRRRAHETFAYPTPDIVLDFVEVGAAPDHRRISRPAQARRIAGLGVAAPFQLWNWAAEIGAPSSAMDDWRTFSIAEELGPDLPLSGDALQRRDLGLRGGILFRRGVAAARLSLFLPRRLPRRRLGAGRRALHRAHRQCGGVRLDADSDAGPRGRPRN